MDWAAAADTAFLFRDTAALFGQAISDIFIAFCKTRAGFANTFFFGHTPLEIYRIRTDKLF